MVALKHYCAQQRYSVIIERKKTGKLGALSTPGMNFKSSKYLGDPVEKLALSEKGDDGDWPQPSREAQEAPLITSSPIPSYLVPVLYSQSY
jgi:hypothetical protein